MRKITSFLLATVMIFVFAGCDASFSDYDFTSSELDFDKDFYFDDDDSSVFSEYSSSSRYNFWGSSSSTKKPSSNTSVKNQNSNQSAQTFYTLTAIGNYLNQQKNANILSVSFNYKGSDEFDAQMLAQMTNAFYINYTYQGDFYTVTITEYPGDHIVDAYFGNNKSFLTADEKKAMDKAVSILNTAKSKAKNSWELELEIHNILAERITYYDDTRDFEDPANAPRHLSIIGALLDGKANCQGYSDTFYTIATMAGFTVSRMSVETKDDLHQVNTILLNDSWYVVDVTFDDQDNAGPLNYRLFNAGLDQIREFTWKPWKEVNKISATSGNNYYYKYKGNLFNDINSFTNYVVNRWLGGEKTVIAAIKNQSDGKKVEKALGAALDKTGKAYNYTSWYFDDTKDFYYTIYFK